MTKIEVSEDLNNFRNILIAEKLDPQNLIEFYCSAEKFEPLKEKYKKSCKSDCYFFSKEEGSQLHVIGLINITITNKSAENTMKVINNIREKSFKQSSFNPNGIFFNNPKGTAPRKP